MAGGNYAAGTPAGKNNIPLYGSPAPVKAVEQYLSENGTASSVITMTDNTTAIEIAAQSTPVAMRWVYATDGTGAQTSVIAVAGATANFDHIIPANTVRRFVVPIETGPYGVAPNSSVVGVAVEAGLFRRLAFKTQGIASVMVTEYGSSNSY